MGNKVIGVDNHIYVNDKVQELTYRSTNKSIQYAIIRIDKKFYTLEAIEGWEYHMEREGQIENVDSSKTYENRVLIGDSNVYANLEKHIKGVWCRKDSCIARDMILTASPDFFRGLMKSDFEKWLTLNVEFLKKSYGDNVIYCVLHNDETTSHLHVLLAVDYINDKGKRVMSNKHFFDGKAMLSQLQSNYAAHMQSYFKSLKRGLKGSKDNHVSIKQYYNLCAKKLDERDMDSVMAKAKNNELMEIKYNNTKKTLNAYKNYQVARDAEKENLQQQNIKLYQELKTMQIENKAYFEGIKKLAEYYKIPAKNITKVLQYCKEKVIEKGR